jgi:hypothetical protein
MEQTPKIRVRTPPTNWFPSGRTVLASLLIVILGTLAVYWVLYERPVSEMPIPSVLVGNFAAHSGVPSSAASIQKSGGDGERFR